MQPRRRKRSGSIEAVLLVGAVLVFAVLAWALSRAGGSTVPAATIVTETQSVVADQPTLVADVPAATAYPPPPYPPPSVGVPSQPGPSVLSPADAYGVGVCADGPLSSDVQYWTQAADLVALGTVAELQPPRWTTPDGTRPANPHTDDETIYSPVVIEVEEYLKGDQPTQRLGILGRGGQIGRDRVDYCGSLRYTFALGKRVIVFLSSPSIWEERYDDLLLWEVADHYKLDGDRANFGEWKPSLEELRSMIETAQEP